MDDPAKCAYLAEKDFARSLLEPFKIEHVHSRIAIVFFHSGTVLSLPLNADPTAMALAIDGVEGGGATSMRPRCLSD